MVNLGANTTWEKASSEMSRLSRFGAEAVALVAATALAASAVAETESIWQKKLGTIRATVEGEERTWHVLEATIDGKLEPGAFWKEMEDGSRLVAIGGYDQADVPFETFERDPESGMVTSFGEYDGGLFTVTFEIREGGGAPMSFAAGVNASVILVPGLDYGSALSLESGHVEIETVDWGSGRFEGSFEGELESMDGSKTARVTDGTFEVRGGRSIDEVN